MMGVGSWVNKHDCCCVSNSVNTLQLTSDITQRGDVHITLRQFSSEFRHFGFTVSSEQTGVNKLFVALNLWCVYPYLDISLPKLQHYASAQTFDLGNVDTVQMMMRSAL